MARDAGESPERRSAPRPLPLPDEPRRLLLYCAVGLGLLAAWLLWRELGREDWQATDGSSSDP